MKTLLKPTLLKLILTFVLLFISSYLWRMYTILTISDTFPWGFPLQFYLAWGPCQLGEVCSESNIFYLIVDIVAWYFVSAFLILIFRRNLIVRGDKTI